MTTDLDTKPTTSTEPAANTNTSQRQAQRTADSLNAGGSNSGKAVHDVIEFSMETAHRLGDVAAQIETRGYKVLFKAMAERHARYAHELAKYTHDPDVDVPPTAMALDELQLGLTTIQTSMTLKREGRQDILLGEIVDEERALLEKYDDAIASRPPAPIDNVLATQRSRLAAAKDNMQRVTDGERELIARLYDDHEDGERALASLRAQGMDEGDIDVIEQRKIRAGMGEAPSTPKTVPTITAAAIGGGVVGLIIGVAWWFLLAAGADAADVTVAEPMTVGPVTLIASSIFFGAVMGAVFGWFIGRNKAEDDAFVSQQSMQAGDILIAVYVPADRVKIVEQTLHVHHGRELLA